MTHPTFYPARISPSLFRPSRGFVLRTVIETGERRQNENSVSYMKVAFGFFFGRHHHRWGRYQKGEVSLLKLQSAYQK